MHSPCEMLRGFEIPFHKSTVDHELRSFVLYTTPPPCLHLALHRLEAPLHAVYSNRYRIDQAEAFCMFCKHGGKISVECHVVADKNAIANGHGKTHRLVVRVPDTN